MILSKKYIESMNKITVDDKLKKRILQKVSEVKEEDNNINTIPSVNRSKYNKMWTKSVGLVAACCALVVCTSLNSKFPELFNKGNTNLNNENVENDDSKIDKITASDESNKEEINIKSEDINTNNEGTVTESADNTSEEDNNYIDNTGKEIRSKVVNNQIHQENIDNSSGNNAESNKTESVIINYAEEQSNSETTNTDISEKNNESHENDSVNYSVIDGAHKNEENNSSSSIIKKQREIPGNMKEEFEIPKDLENNAEITYTLLVSDDVMEVGYKYKDCGDGILRISSHEVNDSAVNYYSDIEILKTSNGEAVLKSNKDNTKKIAEWQFNNKFYSLNIDADCDNEEIKKIIESCR